MSLTAGAGTRCMSLLSSSPSLMAYHGDESKRDDENETVTSSSFFLGGHCQTVSQPPRRRRKRERKRELYLDQHYERKDPDPISFSWLIKY
jgi:hypothetical protein